MANFKEKNQITAEIILIEDEIVSEALQYNDVKLMRRALERMGLRDNYFTLVRGESKKLGDVLSTASQRVEVVLCVGSQERLVSQIADTIMENLNPLGAMVVCEAQHFCMISRGVEKQNSIMVTNAIRGVFQEIEARNEALSLFGK